MASGMRQRNISAKTPPTTLQQSRNLDRKVDEIISLIATKKLARERLNVYERPIACFGHFLAVVGGWVVAALPYACALLLLVVGLVLLRDLGSLGPSASAAIDSLFFCARFSSWWFGLGVLQTVGFGSGLQSGVMFMLPHVLRTAFAAQRCGSLGFASLGDVWYDASPILFACADTAASAGDVTVEAASVVALLVRLLPSAMIFQAGATCGEVPPYFMSFTAAEAQRINALVDADEGGGRSGGGGSSQGGHSDDAWIDMLLDPARTPKRAPLTRRPSLAPSTPVGGGGEGSTSSWDAAVAQMEGFIDAHGFWAIWALATFPCGAFDLCGVCCGQLRVPFGTFFGATLSGKVLVRGPVQTLALLLAAQPTTAAHLVSSVGRLAATLRLPPEWEAEAWARGHVSHLRTLGGAADDGDGGAPAVSAVGDGAEDGWGLGEVWGCVVGLLMAYFLLSTVQEVARQRAARLDEDEIVRARAVAGLDEQAYPHLHLSPALRSPKAREALRQPLFSTPRTPRAPGGGLAGSSSPHDRGTASTPLTESTPKRPRVLDVTTPPATPVAAKGLGRTPATLAKSYAATPEEQPAGGASPATGGGDLKGRSAEKVLRSGEGQRGNMPVPEKLALDDDDDDDVEKEKEREKESR